jgi:hypothetical protein
VTDRSLELYEAKVERSAGPDACHPWTGARSKDGHGFFKRDGENYAARWGYRRFIGPLSKDEIVRHTCDNPPCQNPRHWVKGTHLDNSNDKVSRGRQHRPRGERNPRAKLTLDVVQTIRRRLRAAPASASLAAEFGISKETLRDIRAGRTWAGVA